MCQFDQHSPRSLVRLHSSTPAEQGGHVLHGVVADSDVRGTKGHRRIKALTVGLRGSPYNASVTVLPSLGHNILLTPDSVDASHAR